MRGLWRIERGAVSVTPTASRLSLATLDSAVSDGRFEVTLRVTAPDHRLDIGTGVVGRADLIEEIARIFGYAHIPAHVPALFEALGAPPDLYQRLGVANPRRLLCWDRSGRKLGDDGDSR